MSNGEKQPIAKLEVIPNPRTFEHPFRVKLIDERTDRTIQADFDLNLTKLADLFVQDNPEKYGGYLYEQVFQQSVNKETGEKGRIASQLRRMLRQAEDAGTGLRLRLEITTSLPELQALAWEYLFDSEYDHETGLALAADRRLTLFRDVDVDAPEREAITGPPRVLAAVVCPVESSLAQFNMKYQMNLKPIPLEAEKERLESLFKRVQREKDRPALLYQILPTATPPGRSKLEQIVEAMDDGQFHVLHLSCHGVILDGKAYLVLADTDGRYSLVSEEDLANQFSHMTYTRLILLDACQSAQQSEMEAFSGMVPQLIRRVPAAIGMQRVWYTGLADDRFISSFYKEFCQHGSVDRALQRARRDLRSWKPERWEWGTPVLYLRLGEGQLFRLKAAPTTTVKPTRPPRHGGTGLYIGPKAKLKDVVIDAKGAGGDIVEGTEPPRAPSKPSGVGIRIEGEVEGVNIRGEFAGGGIYRRALAAQDSKRFTQMDHDQAIRGQIDYYRRRLVELQASMEGEAEADMARIQAELRDIQEEIDELKQLLS